MSANAPDPRAMLEAWRDQGADRLDPLGFARIEALARRAASREGALRALLEARIGELVDAYAARLAREPQVAPLPARLRPRVARGPSALSDLLRQLACREPPQQTPSANGAPPARRPLDMLDEVRRLSSEARTESRLRQTMLEPCGEAGPLNSTRLVHRALRLMQTASPAYLEAMLAHVEALAWIEDMALTGDANGRTLQPAGTPTRGVRARARRSRTPAG